MKIAVDFRLLPEIFENFSNELSEINRGLFRESQEVLVEIDKHIYEF